GERLRIVDREWVDKRALIGARESLDHAQVFAGSSEVGLTGEVRRLDDERRPFPTTTGFARQTLHLLGKMRAPIQGNDANVVNHLDENGDEFRSLQDLIVVV